MAFEILAIIVTTLGGFIGIVGNTWDKDRGQPTLTGYLTFGVVALASIFALIRVVDYYDEEVERKHREAKFSYYALMEIYGPLSMWLADLRIVSENDGDTSYKFPPELYLDIYEKLNGDASPLEGLGRYLSQGHTTPSGTVRYDVAESFASRYQLIHSSLDAVISQYGSHISSSVLEHLIALRSHSLFRYSRESQNRDVGRACRGSIDQIVLQSIDPSTAAVDKRRCIQVVDRLLAKMVQDAPPAPPFLLSMEKEHQAYCQTAGIRIPFCAWVGINDPATASSSQSNTHL